METDISARQDNSATRNNVFMRLYETKMCSTHFRILFIQNRDSMGNDNKHTADEEHKSQKTKIFMVPSHFYYFLKLYACAISKKLCRHAELRRL